MSVHYLHHGAMVRNEVSAPLPRRKWDWERIITWALGVPAVIATGYLALFGAITLLSRV